VRYWGLAFRDTSVREDRAGHRHAQVGLEGGRKGFLFKWELQVEFSGADGIVGAPEPRGKWVLGRDRRGGYPPHFIESKRRLREVCLPPSQWPDFNQSPSLWKP